MKDETVWLNTEQMAKLFDRDYKTIRKHINNALEEELDNSTIAKFATVQKEGDRNVPREIEHYNLDMIISVDYRVKSKNGILFRKWASQILKDYMIKGYAVNQKRLEYLEKTVKLIDIANRIDGKSNDYDTIILGTPVWWYRETPVIRTFLKENDLSSKTIIPYATNAGWLGKTFTEIKKLCQNSKVESEMNIVFESYSNELVTSKSDIDKWINDIKEL